MTADSCLIRSECKWQVTRYVIALITGLALSVLIPHPEAGLQVASARASSQDVVTSRHNVDAALAALTFTPEGKKVVMDRVCRSVAGTSRNGRPVTCPSFEEISFAEGGINCRGEIYAMWARWRDPASPDIQRGAPLSRLPLRSLVSEPFRPLFGDLTGCPPPV